MKIMKSMKNMKNIIDNTHIIDNKNVLSNIPSRLESREGKSISEENTVAAEDVVSSNIDDVEENSDTDESYAAEETIPNDISNSDVNNAVGRRFVTANDMNYDAEENSDIDESDAAEETIPNDISSMNYYNSDSIGALESVAEVIMLLVINAVSWSPNEEDTNLLPHIEEVGMSIGWEQTINSFSSSVWGSDLADFSAQDVLTESREGGMFNPEGMATLQLSLATVGLFLVGDAVSMVILD